MSILIKDANGATQSVSTINDLMTIAATQTTAAAILAKLVAAPATEAKQDAILTALSGLAGYLDGLEALIGTTNSGQASVLAALQNRSLVTATAQLLASAATTNATSVKTSACYLQKIIGDSDRTSRCYLKLYNKASAPVVGTDVPLVTIPLPAQTPFAIDFNAMSFPVGFAFALTVNGSAADATAIAASDVVGLNFLFSA